MSFPTKPTEVKRTLRTGSSLDKAFYLSLYIKIANGVLQLIGGAALLFLKPAQIVRHLSFFTSRSVDQDFDDAIFHGIANYLAHLTGGNLKFAALYLIADATLKLVLINEILHERYWAYLALIAVLSLLIIFQSYQIFMHHSLLLSLLTIFDVVVIYLSAKEYLKHQRNKIA